MSTRPKTPTNKKNSSLCGGMSLDRLDLGVSPFAVDLSVLSEVKLYPLFAKKSFPQTTVSLSPDQLTLAVHRSDGLHEVSFNFLERNLGTHLSAKDSTDFSNLCICSNTQSLFIRFSSNTQSLCKH